MESAVKISGFDFAARQRHSFENALVTECGFLIILSRRAAFLSSALSCLSVIENGHARANHRRCVTIAWTPCNHDTTPMSGGIGMHSRHSFACAVRNRSAFDSEENFES
jgi:hypothetical protein